MSKRYSQEEKDLIKSLLCMNKKCNEISKQLKAKFRTSRDTKSLNNQINSNRGFYGYKQQKRKAENRIQDFENRVNNNKFEILNQPNHTNEADIKELWESLVQKKTESLKKNKYNIDLKFAEERPIAIAFMSDVHLGNPGTDYATLEKHVDIINEVENQYVFMGGDLIDNFIIEKILEAVDATEVKVDSQWRLAEHFLKKLDGKILAVGNGNHTQWTMKRALFDNLKIMSQRMNLIYTAHGAMMNLQVGETQEYKIHVRHKYRFNSSINRFNAHQRLYELGPETADITVLEHQHEPGSISYWRHGLKRYGLNTGSYKMDDTYALDCGFFSSNIGVPCIILFPGERRIIQFEQIEDCALVMKYLNQEY